VVVVEVAPKKVLVVEVGEDIPLLQQPYLQDLQVHYL
jgi:hypothetical protein